jgi:Tol biopolymer transport system component
MRDTRIATLLTGLAVIALGAAVPAAAQQPSAEVLLEQAMHVERVEGNLQRAIELYQRVLREHPSDRTVAATAQLHIGICYETLGLNEAQGAYRRVVQEYPDQLAMVAEARGRLTRLQRLAAGGAAVAGIGAGEAEGAGLVLRRLQADPGGGFLDGGPTPDGRSFAYIDYATGDVALWDLATGEHRRLTYEGSWVPPEQYAINVSVSPDGKTVAYTWAKGQDSVVELRVVGLNDSAPRTLCGNTDHVGYPMSWSPDGRHIAVPVFNRADSTGAIAWVSVEDGSMRRLATLPRWHWGTLSHSSDGAFVAMEYPVQADSGRHDVFLVATDGAGMVPLVRHPADDRLLGWMPNSNHLLFLSDRSGEWDALEVEVIGGRASGEPRVVKRSVGDILPLGFTRSGAFFYGLSTWHFTASVAPFNATTGEMDVTASRPLRGSHVAAVWSPDGEHLALVVQVTPGRGELSLAVRNVATGEERLLAPQLAPDKPSWFPDGKAILVAAQRKDRPRAGEALYQVDVATGHAEALLEFPPEPSWSNLGSVPGIGGLMRDGEYLIYVHDGRLRQRHLPSGREVELFRDPGLTTRLLALSPNGAELVFAVNDSTDGARPHPMTELHNAGRLMIVSLEGGEVRELLKVSEPGTVRSLNWTPDGHHVLFLQVLPGRSGAGAELGSVLWRVSREGGDAERVWQFGRRVYSFALSPDGSQASYAVPDTESEVWVMENLGAVLEHGR